MKVSYKITNTPDHLLKMQTPKYYIRFLCDGTEDFEYSRRAKNFYPSLEEAEAAGKRYLRKMKKNGFEV